MQSRWPVERYARCCARYQDQYSDVHGDPLYMLMGCMEASQAVMSPSAASLVNTGLWSAISVTDLVDLAAELHVHAADACTISVVARIKTGEGRGSDVLLVSCAGSPCLT